jgi:hypothetical protein
MSIRIKQFGLTLVIFVLAATAFGQSDRGTITGAVTDQSGAVIPGVPVIATNVATGVSFNTQTTETGNFTILSVPVGSYSLRVEKAGFRTFQQTGITVQVAQTVRINVTLDVGNATETVEVRGDASLLRTESVEQSTVLNGDKINQLPLNFANNGVRNPLTFLQLAPGASVGGWNDIRVNGSPAGTFRVIFEGQDATSALNPRLFNESQPTIDAVEEFALQSTNFSAEFGQVGGGLVNFTARSGTNQFHGTVFDYVNNEALNAAPTFAPIASYALQSIKANHCLVPHIVGDYGRRSYRFWGRDCDEDYRSDYTNDTCRRDALRLELFDAGAKQPCPEDLSNTLTALRYDGVVQRQFVVANPDFFPAIPALSLLAGFQPMQTIQRISATLRAPYIMQSPQLRARPRLGHGESAHRQDHRIRRIG